MTYLRQDHTLSVPASLWEIRSGLGVGRGSFLGAEALGPGLGGAHRAKGLLELLTHPSVCIVNSPRQQNPWIWDLNLGLATAHSLGHGGKPHIRVGDREFTFLISSQVKVTQDSHFESYCSSHPFQNVGINNSTVVLTWLEYCRDYCINICKSFRIVSGTQAALVLLLICPKVFLIKRYSQVFKF